MLMINTTVEFIFLMLYPLLFSLPPPSQGGGVCGWVVGGSAGQWCLSGEFLSFKPCAVSDYDFALPFRLI